MATKRRISQSIGGGLSGARVHKSSRSKGSFSSEGFKTKWWRRDKSLSLVSRAMSLVADDQRQRRATWDAGSLKVNKKKRSSQRVSQKTKE